MKKLIALPCLILLSLSLQGCIVSTVVGAAVDVTAEVVKAPFKIGGAIYDGVSGLSGSDDKKKDSDKQTNAADNIDSISN